MGKTKHKKKSSKNKKHKSSKQKLSSGDSSSSEDEWVEMVPSTSTSNQNSSIKEKDRVNLERDDWMCSPALFACVSRAEIQKTKEQKKNKNEEDKYMLDKLGKTDRELNPYWKDGGSGLPEENPVTTDSLRQASVTVGDQGVAWLHKALQRAKEQAEDQKRSLQDVVAERWGSLDKLESMIAAAEDREKRSYNKFNEDKYDYRKKERYFDRKSYKNKNERYNSGQDSYMKYEKESRSNRSKKDTKTLPDSDSDSSNYSDKRLKRTENKDDIKTPSAKLVQCKDKIDKGTKYDKYEKDSKRQKKSFAKPTESSEESEDTTCSNSSREPNSRQKNVNRPANSSDEDERDLKKYKSSKYDKYKNSGKMFAKPSISSSEDERIYHKNERTNYDKYKEKESTKNNAKIQRRTFVKPHNNSDDDSYVSNVYQSRKENHKTCSSSGSGWKKKITSHDKEEKAKDSHHELDTKHIDIKEVEEQPELKEEPMLTDKELNDLGAKLVKAELLGNDELAKQLKSKLEKAREAKANKPQRTEVSEEVVILTHTDSKGFTRPVSLKGLSEPSGGRRKAKKVETHSEGKRVRYFADDDKYSLQDMFQREKLSTVEDSNEVFAKLASKGVGREDSVRDMDDVFEETARMEEAEGKKHSRERQHAIEQSKRTARSLDNCQWCLESQRMLKHLIIAIGSTCYLCVPPYQSLTENHCLIVPTHHTPCATQLDEDVWREIQDFRRSIVQMFQSQDEDVVFFESARHLNRFPHMVLNCVPMPKETGDMAPIYFKKAIQECEMEWSNNKKLVDLRGRDVRRAVPKGLPYFAVDFGMDSGFAHVIEDEKLFPENFAQEIIGGMLDLDHTIWRKQRKQTFEEQSKKVIQLTKLWNPFDCSKKK